MKKIIIFLVVVINLVFAQNLEEKQQMNKRCDDGDANICYALAKISERSGSLLQNKNTPESRMYYKKAAEGYKKQCEEASDIASCAIIGNMYLNGQGISEDQFKAKEYFTKACEAKEQEGCVGIGKLHLTGVSARKDFNKAKEYFISACNNKNQNGCLFMAQMYEEGKGVGKSKSLAKEYYGKACDNNSGIGCAKYAEMTK